MRWTCGKHWISMFVHERMDSWPSLATLLVWKCPRTWNSLSPVANYKLPYNNVLHKLAARCSGKTRAHKRSDVITRDFQKRIFAVTVNMKPGFSNSAVYMIPCNVLLSLQWPWSHNTISVYSPNRATFRIRKKQILSHPSSFPNRGSADRHHYGSNICIYPPCLASRRRDTQCLRSIANHLSNVCFANHRKFYHIYGFHNGKRI